MVMYSSAYCFYYLQIRDGCNLSSSVEIMVANCVTSYEIVRKMLENLTN